MKEFNLEHETLINFDLHPIEKTAKGATPHKKVVTEIEFYKHHWVGEQDIYLKIKLSKSAIIDLYTHIKAIESTTVIAETFDLPF